MLGWMTFSSLVPNVAGVFGFMEEVQKHPAAYRGQEVVLSLPSAGAGLAEHAERTKQQYKALFETVQTPSTIQVEDKDQLGLNSSEENVSTHKPLSEAESAALRDSDRTAYTLVRWVCTGVISLFGILLARLLWPVVNPQ